MNKQIDLPIADVQGSLDTRHIAIDRVGIKAIRHPVVVADKGGGSQHTVAQFNMYVNLPHNFKGTHMSRFVEILNSHEREISVESFEEILRSMVSRLESDSGHIEMAFPYFINKSAPVSGVKSLLDYEVTFIGEIKHGNQYSFTMKVIVPVTSLCPCSKKYPTTVHTTSVHMSRFRCVPIVSSGSRTSSESRKSRPHANCTAC